MRVRIIISVASLNGTFNEGEVCDVPEEVARRWIDSGIAMEDKSLDGGAENKASVTGKSTMRRTRHGAE